MKHLTALSLLLITAAVFGQDLWLDVDTAVTVPVNIVALTTDGTTADTGVVYNEAGLAMYWNFVTTAGVVTQTQFDPCNTGGDYDWSHVGGGLYKIEIPASGGADMNNDTEGTGWVSGASTANYIWRGPTIGFRAAGMNNALIDNGTVATNFEDTFDGTGYAGGTIEWTVDAKEISADATIANNLQTIAAALLEVFSTDYATAYDTTNNRWNVDVAAMESDTVTAAAIATDAIGAAEAGFLTDSTGFQGADVAAILVDTGTTLDDFLDTEIAAILTDTGTTIPATISTAQADLDILTGADGVNLLSATQASIDAIEADTAAQDTAGEWTTLMGDGSGLTEAGGTGDHLTAITGALPASALPYEAEIASVTSQQVLVMSTGPNVDKAHVDGWVVILDDSESDLVWSFHRVNSYVGSTKTMTIQNAPLFTVAADDSVIFLTSAPNMRDIILNTTGSR